MKSIMCYFDGCCEPHNPGGCMGIGAIVRVDGKDVFAYSGFMPENEANTNNIAEYLSLEMCIDYLLENNLDGDDIIVHGDSQMAIKQMSGEYRMNSGSYIRYAKRCLTKIASFRRLPKFQWIPREQNNDADELSKKHLIEKKIAIAKWGEEGDVLMFGKYKGKPIASLTDVGYLNWLLREAKLKKTMIFAIEKRVKELYNTV